MSERCRIILRCGDGLPSKAVAAELGVHEYTVGEVAAGGSCMIASKACWMRCGPAGHARSMTIRLPPSLSARCARRRPTPQHTGRSAPWLESPDFHTRRSAGIWTAFGLQPHRSETFKLSSDPLFVDKVRDIVGLYLSPPNRALVLSVDEKSQTQALDLLKQPVLPMMLGVPERRTHSYIRHEYDFVICLRSMSPSGFVIGKMLQAPPRDHEFLDFLKRIDAQVPNGLDVHIIMDNYATHKTAAIKAWLARRPHYHAHFTPTSASWINQVERWFAELTRKEAPARRPYLDPSARSRYPLLHRAPQ